MEYCLTVDNDALLKARLSRIADQEKNINKADESDLTIPSRAVDKYVPRMNITSNISTNIV